MIMWENFQAAVKEEIVKDLEMHGTRLKVYRAINWSLVPWDGYFEQQLPIALKGALIAIEIAEVTI